MLRSPTELSKHGPPPSAALNRRAAIQVPSRTRTRVLSQVCSSELDYLKLKNGAFWLLACGWCLARAQPHNPAKPQVSPAVAIQRHPPPPLSCCSLPRHPFPTPPPGADQLTLPHRHRRLKWLSLAKPAHMRHFSIMHLEGHNTGNRKSHHGNTVILPVIPRVLLQWYY